MIVLHIARITNDKCSGVSVAVPKYVISQQQVTQTAFINISNVIISGTDKQLKYEKNFSIDKLPVPFNIPDIVVFHELYIPEFLSISKQLIKRKIPYVIIPHGGLTKVAQAQKWIKKKVANFLLFNHYFNNAAAIQYLSVSEQNNSIVKSNSFICANGIELPNEVKTKFNQRSLTFLFIGRYDIHIKGIDLLLDAIKIKKDFLRQNNIYFKLFGIDVNGSFNRIVQCITDYEIDDIVELNGEIHGKEKANQILNADIFVQTSRSEGMPMGILEALSYGLPCIVTEGTGLHQLIKNSDAGYACETSAESIANALYSACVESNLIPEKSKKARRIIEDKFDENIIVKENIAKYKNLLDMQKGK